MNRRTDIFVVFTDCAYFLMASLTYNKVILGEQILLHVLFFRTQDTFGFIIQETLKFYELNDDDTPTGQERVRHLSSPLWKDLGPDYQEVLSPFLTSKYTVIPMQDDERHPLPIFRPRSSLVFSEWMRDWTVSLIDRITTDTVTSHFFLKCGKLLQTDLNRCLILLPHIVVYLLLFGDAEVTKDIGKILLERLILESN